MCLRVASPAGRKRIPSGGPKVRADGTVKLLDFGLAKAIDPAGSSGAAVMNSPTITVHGTHVG